LDAEEFLRLGDGYERPRTQRASSEERAPGADQGTENTWAALFAPHPEGAGPFGGRDNALTALVGFERAKRFPFEGGVVFALHWNVTYCDPPLDEAFVRERVSRAWAEWTEGDEPDATPADLRHTSPEAQEWQIKSGDYLLDLETGGGGLAWFIKNVLVRGGYHFVSAPAAGAKTWFLIDLAVAVASGRSWLALDVPQAPVLYLDMEIGEAQFSTRFKKLGAARGLPFHYLDEDVKLDRRADVDRLVALIQQRNIELLVIDTFSRVWTGDENDNRQVRAFGATIKAIRKKTGVTVVLAHHDRKTRLDGDSPIGHEKMRGGGDIAAQCDLAYAITRAGENLFEVTTTKNRVLPAADALHVFFTLEDNDDRTTVTLKTVDAAARSEQAQDDMAGRIRSALTQHGALNQTQLTERVGARKSLVVAAAERLLTEGEITCEPGARGTKMYRIPEAQN